MAIGTTTTALDRERPAGFPQPLSLSAECPALGNFVPRLSLLADRRTNRAQPQHRNFQRPPLVWSLVQTSPHYTPADDLGGTRCTTFTASVYVTERYPHLQGLRLAPLGVPFLLSAAWRRGQLSWVPGTSGHGPGYWFLGLMALALIVSIALARYYRQRFGSVQLARRLKGPLLFCGFIALFLAST